MEADRVCGVSTQWALLHPLSGLSRQPVRGVPEPPNPQRVHSPGNAWCWCLHGHLSRETTWPVHTGLGEEEKLRTWRRVTQQLDEQEWVWRERALAEEEQELDSYTVCVRPIP